MPSIDIHLAIARQYLKKHIDIRNTKDFIKGNIAPDLVEDKKVSHYTGEGNNVDNLVDALRNKVIIDKYLSCNKVETDYEKGVFLHLVVDYLFFNNFFDKEYLLKMSDGEFKKDLYYSYGITNEYLKTKYDTSYGELKVIIENNIANGRKKAHYNGEKRINIIPFEKLDKYIEMISDKDIEFYINYKDFT